MAELHDARAQGLDEARRLAQQAQGAAAAGEPAAAVAWFDALYASAAGEAERVPWARLSPNPYYAEWADQYLPRGCGRSALVVGCGLGDDAEDLAARGYETTAFDVSPAAVAWCLKRFPNTAVRYRVADLLDHPPAWHRGFDVVLEVFTLQALPEALRSRAVRHMADCLAPGGTLLVVTQGRDEADALGAVPWPLTKAQVRAFGWHGLREVSFDELTAEGDSPTRLFRAAFTKA